MPRLTRRDFIKLSGAAAASVPLLKIPWASADDILTAAALTTLDQTIVKGQLVKPGQQAWGGYYKLAAGPGEPYIQRTELGTPSSAPIHCATAFVQFTDVHLIDAQSPARVEWMDRFVDNQCSVFPLNAAFRPHETMQTQVLEAMVQRIRAIKRGPATGKRFRFLVSTGDNVDNEQHNELRWFIDLLDGGKTVTPDSGALGTYEGVQQKDWGDIEYWHPDRVNDKYKKIFGFPDYPGLLESAIRPFRATGIGLPWWQAYGNHDGLIQGNAPRTEAFNAIAVGGLKFDAPPPDVDPCDPFASMDTWVPTHPVTADAGRYVFRREQYVAEMFDTTGTPVGHGFTAQNEADGTAYYVRDDIPNFRFITLDTVNPGGYDEGSIGQVQLDWLVARLQEVSGVYYDANGNQVSNPSAENRLVILFSHHGLRSLDNPFQDPNPDDPTANDLPRYQSDTIEPIIHRFPNVVAWVNGHTHDNVITPRPDPSGLTNGFWDIGTAAHVDWTSQSRIVEVAHRTDGTLSIFCTIVDHAAPIDPSGAFGVMRLASIHRELTGNDPQYGFDSKGPGQPQDRNVELLLPAPSWLQ